MAKRRSIRLPQLWSEHVKSGVLHAIALTTGHPFSGVQSGFYRSSTTYAADPINVWFVELDFGRVSATGKGFAHLVWPVRGRQ